MVPMLNDARDRRKAQTLTSSTNPYYLCYANIDGLVMGRITSVEGYTVQSPLSCLGSGNSTTNLLRLPLLCGNTTSYYFDPLMRCCFHVWISNGLHFPFGSMSSRFWYKYLSCAVFLNALCSRPSLYVHVARHWLTWRAY